MSTHQLLIEFTQTAQDLYHHYKTLGPDGRELAENIKTLIEIGHKAYELGKDLNERHKEHIDELVKEHPLSPENSPANMMLGATEKDIKEVFAQQQAADKSRQDLTELLQAIETRFPQQREQLQKDFQVLRDLQDKMLMVEQQRLNDQQAKDRAARAGRDWEGSR